MDIKKEIIYAFIDSQNLNLAIKNDLHDKNGDLLHKGWTLDFGKFHALLKNKYRVEKAFLFFVAEICQLFCFCEPLGKSAEEIKKQTSVRDEPLT